MHLVTLKGNWVWLDVYVRMRSWTPGTIGNVQMAGPIALALILSHMTYVNQSDASFEKEFAIWNQWPVKQ